MDISDEFKPPSWMIPFGRCINNGCNGIVFGKRVGDSIVPLKSENGKPVTVCASCIIKRDDERYARDIAMAEERWAEDAAKRERAGIGRHQVLSNVKNPGGRTI